MATTVPDRRPGRFGTAVRRGTAWSRLGHAGQDGGPDKPTTGSAFALLGIMQATLIFTITVLSVPLPVIGRQWGLGQSSLVLISAAYGLSFSGLLLFGGRLTDQYGGRRMFTAGLVVFAAASMVAVLAQGIAVLTAARFAQGAGAALVAPAAVAVLRQVFPDPVGYSRAIATWGGLSVLGATLGTLLSGIVATWLSWRWMLAVPLVIAAVAAVATPQLLPEGTRHSRATLDLPGALLATTGITLLSFGLVVTGEHAWTSAIALTPLALGLVLLGAFVAVELSSADPLLPMPSWSISGGRPRSSRSPCPRPEPPSSRSCWFCISNRSETGRRCVRRWRSFLTPWCSSWSVGCPGGSSPAGEPTALPPQGSRWRLVACSSWPVWIRKPDTASVCCRVSLSCRPESRCPSPPGR
ncbi:MFS family permease [Hamadaea flava]|nr:MFS family permease [Hamadaea flava]